VPNAGGVIRIILFVIFDQVHVAFFAAVENPVYLGPVPTDHAKDRPVGTGVHSLHAVAFGKAIPFAEKSLRP